MGEATPEESKPVTELAGLVPIYAGKPLFFKPGERWLYCQSGINMAGRVVEVVSGKSLPEFFESRIFKPLGMTDTTFYLSEAQSQRLATSYTKTKAGALEPAQNFILLGHRATSRQRFPAANGGLFSTAGDYVKFCQLILNRGKHGDKQLVSEKSVETMTTLQSGDLKTGFTEGNGWGLGWCLVRKPQGPSEVLSPGSFGHGGAYGTQAWIDPMKKRVYLLMVQRANFPNADASDVRRAFQAKAAAALAK
jgi:CubicO group peptidase (beta-lactamase class C family)